MPVQDPVRGLVHSYSSISCYEICAHQFRDRYVLRNKHPSTPEQAAGTAHHLALQRRLEDRRPLPPELDAAEGMVTSLERRGALMAERKLGMARDFTACDFWAHHAWVRGVLDVYTLLSDDAALIADWKTGKVRENDLQLMICALLVFANEPSVDTVYSTNLWLKAGKPGALYTFNRFQAGEYRARLIEHTNRIEADRVFAARPSPLCKWCPVAECKERKHAYGS